MFTSCLITCFVHVASEGGASHLTALMELCDKIIRLFLKEAAINFNKVIHINYRKCNIIVNLVLIHATLGFF